MGKYPSTLSKIHHHRLHHVNHTRYQKPNTKMTTETSVTLSPQRRRCLAALAHGVDFLRCNLHPCPHCSLHQFASHVFKPDAPGRVQPTLMKYHASIHMVGHSSASRLRSTRSIIPSQHPLHVWSRLMARRSLLCDIAINKASSRAHAIARRSCRPQCTTPAARSFSCMPALFHTHPRTQIADPAVPLSSPRCRR